MYTTCVMCRIYDLHVCLTNSLISQLNLIVDTNTVSTFKPDANARTPKRARAACHCNALQATAVRYVGRYGPRHRVPAKKAKENPVKIVYNYDAMGILQHDGGKFTDSEVFIVYEDRNEHLHAETAKNGQLPMRLTLNAVAEQVSINHP